MRLKDGTRSLSQRQILLFSSWRLLELWVYRLRCVRLGAETPCKKWLSRNASSPHRVAGVTRDKFLRVPLFLQATMGREEFRRESEGNFSGGESVLCACCRQCKVNISEVWSGISNEAAAVIAFPITRRRASFQNESGEKTTPGQWLIFMTRTACMLHTENKLCNFLPPYIYACGTTFVAGSVSGICLVA